MTKSVLAPILLITIILGGSGRSMAQQTINTGEVAGFPMLGSSSTHATVAVNERGDLMLAWSSAVTINGTKTKQVEGAFLARTGTDSWEIPAKSSLWLLGEVGVTGTGAIERCHKPDVVSLGNDFVVFFPRIVNGVQTGAMEAVRIAVNASGIASLDAPSPGHGYVLDPDFYPGESGGMPDGVRLQFQRNNPAVAREGLAAVFYAHISRSAGDERDFDLRAATIDFNQVPPVINGPIVAASALPVDFSGTYPGGGMLLPDAVEDDFGNIVVAWEEYTNASRGGASDSGKLVVRSFLKSASGLQVNGSIELVGVDPLDRQRRPNLATSRADNSNSISIAWIDCEQDGSDPRTRYGLLDFVGGTINFNDANFPNWPTVEEQRPTCVHGDKFRAGVSEHVAGGTSKMIAWSMVNGPKLINIPLSGYLPIRPALDLLENQTHQPGQRILPLSFEVDFTNSSGVHFQRIFLAVFKI